MLSQGQPVVTAVLADPGGARGGAESQPLARGIEIQGMAVDQVVGPGLGQAAAQGLEAAATVAGAVHHHAAFGGNAPLVLDGRHEPGRVRILRMHHHREAEDGRLHIDNLCPSGAVVQGRLPGPIPGILQGEGYVVPQEGDRFQCPFPRPLAAGGEEPLTGGHEDLIGHFNLQKGPA